MKRGTETVLANQSEERRSSICISKGLAGGVPTSLPSIDNTNTIATNTNVKTKVVKNYCGCLDAYGTSCTCLRHCLALLACRIPIAVGNSPFRSFCLLLACLLAYLIRVIYERELRRERGRWSTVFCFSSLFSSLFVALGGGGGEGRERESLGCFLMIKS